MITPRLRFIPATPVRFWRTGAIAVVMAALGSARAMPPDQRQMLSRPSPFGVAQTAQRIEAAARKHGLGVLLRVRQPLAQTWWRPMQASAMVLVLESAEGGTPVLMQGEGDTLHSELPLRIEVQPHDDGTSRILTPAHFGEQLEVLPPGLVEDLAGLPDVVSSALQSQG